MGVKLVRMSNFSSNVQCTLNFAKLNMISMEEECNRLVTESINKIYVDMAEYPVTIDLHAHTALFPYKMLEWGFRLLLVKSINVSGLVYTGIGWIVWCSRHGISP